MGSAGGSGRGQCNQEISAMSLSAWASLVSSPFCVLFLLLVMTANVAESVPTAEFLASSSSSGNSDGGEKEMAMSGRSLYWSSDSSLEKRSRDVQPIQLCGYRLLEAVRGLCRGNYVGYNRRSDPEMRDERVSMMMMRDAPDDDSPRDANIYNMNTMSHSDSGDDDEDTDLHRNSQVDSMGLMSSVKSSKLRLKSKSKAHLRFRRNIIDECCKKPCSVNEMLRYCGRN